VRQSSEAPGVGQARRRGAELHRGRAEHDPEQPLPDEARQQAPAQQERGGRELVGGGEHGPIIDAAPPRPASENAS